MVKDKKSNNNYNQNTNRSRNIKKQSQSPHNARGNEQFNQKKRNQQSTNKKRGQNSTNEFQLPPNKSKTATNISSQAPALSNPASTKKANTAKPEQVQEAKNRLQELQKVLNSYEQLEMDKSQNLKYLVDLILQKAAKIV